MNRTVDRPEPSRSHAREPEKAASTAIATGTTYEPAPARTSQPDPDRLARVARRVRLLIPSTGGDVRAELEEIRDELDALAGPGAVVLPLRGAGR